MNSRRLPNGPDPVITRRRPITRQSSNLARGRSRRNASSRNARRGSASVQEGMVSRDSGNLRRPDGLLRTFEHGNLNIGIDDLNMEIGIEEPLVFDCRMIHAEAILENYLGVMTAECESCGSNYFEGEMVKGADEQCCNGGRLST